jgi:hypothetical protein
MTCIRCDEDDMRSAGNVRFSWPNSQGVTAGPLCYGCTRDLIAFVQNLEGVEPRRNKQRIAADRERFGPCVSSHGCVVRGRHQMHRDAFGGTWPVT